MVRWTEKQIVAELRRVYKANKERPYSRREYQAKGKISKTTIENRFGSWTKALSKANLLQKFKKATAVTRRTKKVVAKKARR